MQLPNGARAVVDMQKLVGYCLNPEHREGKHKARVFASALGITVDDAEELRSALLTAAGEAEAIPGEQDEYGIRYTTDFLMTGPAGKAMVRAAWIIRASEGFPRLTTCYVV